MDPAQWTDANWARRHDLAYKCQLSALYHRKRERFFALLDKISSAAALVAGSAAMSDLLPGAPAKAMAGAAVAALTLPGLVFGWADRARAHALLATRFIALHAEMEGAGVLNAQALDGFSARTISIECDEPPQLSALTRLCQNELALAMGQVNKATTMGTTERWLAHFFDMPKASP